MSNENRKKLIRVGAPLVRVKLEMKPCQPVEGPITQGPLIRVGHPMQRVNLEMKPCLPTLVLTFAIDPERSLTPEAVMAKVGRIAELVKGCGFAYELMNEPAATGQMAVQFLPIHADAISRLPWLKEKLTPVIADIREVTKPVWSEVPAAKA